METHFYAKTTNFKVCYSPDSNSAYRNYLISTSETFLLENALGFYNLSKVIQTIARSQCVMKSGPPFIFLQITYLPINSYSIQLADLFHVIRI